jgi:hypothetical protein
VPAHDATVTMSIAATARDADPMYRDGRPAGIGVLLTLNLAAAGALPTALEATPRSCRARVDREAMFEQRETNGDSDGPTR